MILNDLYVAPERVGGASAGALMEAARLMAEESWGRLLSWRIATDNAMGGPGTLTKLVGTREGRDVRTDSR